MSIGVCGASGICQGRLLEVHGLETIWDFVGSQLSVTCDVCCVAVLGFIGIYWASVGGYFVVIGKQET